MGNFFRGSGVLLDDNTIPGAKIPAELEPLIPKIFDAVRDFGCNIGPTVIQMVTHDEMSEIASYGGFPIRYPHWSFGMQYEELQRGYEHGMHRIYEMVVNSTPCYIYCMNSNTLLDNVLVIAHALGHDDFFKTNVFFSKTDQNMMNVFANNGEIIRKYMRRWGRMRVGAFLDMVLRLTTLVDPSKAWEQKRINEIITKDKRNFRHPKVIEGDHEYMHSFLNPKDWIEKQNKEIQIKEIKDEMAIFVNKTRDILGFLRDNAPLKPWQADIVDIIYKEALYFAPQRATKMLNEGWASYIDFKMMAEYGLCSLGQKDESSGIIEYAKHKTGVLGGNESMNPYKLGFSLFLDIEERWNKGRFGREYDECDDVQKKENWDTKANLGKQKVFEVRAGYNDWLAINEFFTQDFCKKNDYFEYKIYNTGDVKIESRNFVKIKNMLLQRYMGGGLPDIVLADNNHRGRGVLLLEHNWDGRTLYDSYTRGVLEAISTIWGNEVVLTTKNKDGEELIYKSKPSRNFAVQVEVEDRESYESDHNKPKTDSGN